MILGITRKIYTYFETKKIAAWKIMLFYLTLIALGIIGLSRYHEPGIMYTLSVDAIFVGVMALLMLMIILSPIIFDAKPTRQE